MPRVSRQEFEQLPLRVHTLLTGIPLYDVWAIDLAHWHPGIPLDQFLKAVPLHSVPMPPFARFLFRVRSLIGGAFGWDRRSELVTDSTFVSRVSAADSKESLMEPGTFKKGFRVVYSSANEHLAEIKNKTVHGVLAVALIEGETSYRLYLGVFVRSVSRFTPYYMAVIAPFRHWIVYPSLLRGFRKRWNETFGIGGEHPGIINLR
jgi:hypothetical protein